VNFVDATSLDFGEKLETSLENFSSATPFYTSLMRKYQINYLGNNLKKDLSFLMFQDTGDIAAYVPLYLCHVNGGNEFSYGGGYLRAPLIAPLETALVRSRVERELFEKISSLAEEHDALAYRAAIDPLSVVRGTSVSNFLRQHGLRDESSSFQLIDLGVSDDELWLSVRKSYRPLIKKADGLYDVKIIDKSNYDIQLCEEYRRLHHLAAGRETRPKETFEIMYNMISHGEAFLVLVKERKGKWIGAFLFFQKNGLVHYSSSATDPTINPSEGAGHLGLWSAIRHAKKEGNRYFQLGWQPYEDEPEYSEKANNIAMFKRGFGGKRVVWFRGSKNYS